MARAIRVEHPDAVYHITARGNRRNKIFDSNRDRERFLEYLAQAASRYGWVISSFVLMTNHYHLVLETPRPNLSTGMRWLNGSYAAYYNRQHRRIGHLFGERYKAIAATASGICLLAPPVKLLLPVCSDPVHAVYGGRHSEKSEGSGRRTRRMIRFARKCQRSFL